MVLRLSSCSVWASLLCSMWYLTSLTGDRTCVLCIARWVLNQWTTRDVPSFLFFLNNILVWNNFRFTGGRKDSTDSSCMDFPSGASGKEPTCQCRRPRRHGSSSWVGTIPLRRAWQPTPVFLPGESHEQRSLAGGSPWGHTESDTTEAMTHVACSVLRL